MKLRTSPDRISRKLRAADVMQSPSADSGFSLERYVTQDDWRLVDRLLEWIAQEHESHETSQLRAWQKLADVVRWIQVVDPTRLSLITDNPRIQKLAKKIAEHSPSHFSISLGQQLFPQVLSQDTTASPAHSYEVALALPWYTVSDIDRYLVEMVQTNPGKLSEVQQLMDQRNIWESLFFKLKAALAAKVFYEAVRIGANICILDPEKQSQVQSLLKPVEADVLEEDQRRVKHLLKERGLYNQGDEESVIKPHLAFSSNLGIIYADGVFLSQEGFIRLGRKKQLGSSPKLPDRLVA